jgi:ABC-type proline/glycine betaine transport system permease subunit
MINSTRFIIGTGVGLLLAGKLDNKARKAVGLTLIAVGTLVSIPVAVSFLGKLQGRQSVAQQIPERHAA